MKEQGKVKFIYKGKQVELNYEDEDNRLGRIPVHSSNNIENVLVIDTDNHKQMIFVNKKLLEDMDSLSIDSMIMHVLTRMVHTEDKTGIIADIFVSNWFGYSRMINLVKAFEPNKDKQIKRVERIERAVVADLGTKLPEKEEIINRFNFI